MLQLDTSVLFAVAANCGQLERLDATAVENTVLFALAENCPKLKSINIKGSRQVHVLYTVNFLKII